MFERTLEHYLEQRIGYFPPDDVCDGVDVAHRYDCGWPDISQQHCEGKGCCYDTKEYHYHNAKHCFYPKGKIFFNICDIQQLNVKNIFWLRIVFCLFVLFYSFICPT